MALIYSTETINLGSRRVFDASGDLTHSADSPRGEDQWEPLLSISHKVVSAGAFMKFSKDLSLEFKAELFKAIRLSVFLTALVFGFLVFQNKTTLHEEIAEMKAKSNRSPASKNLLPSQIEKSAE